MRVHMRPRPQHAADPEACGRAGRSGLPQILAGHVRLHGILDARPTDGDSKGLAAASHPFEPDDEGM
jgi:hypothetical protein